ncbi:MAG TPA: GNAT family N-acetyltransferase [Clostridia bacterium]|nr:GNAT family N-acetyltransferase [Clostridia bacterium]
MSMIKNPNIKLKEKLDKKDYEDISNLQKLCIEADKTTLKLEIDYKLSGAEEKGEGLKNINEFMFYEGNKLIGYIGICQFGGAAIEVNGMVHPEYRKKGVFKRLFPLVKDEWSKRESQKMLLLSDHNSVSGLGFIKYTGADYDCSEYEMYLRGNVKQDSMLSNVVLRKATNKDAKWIALQSSINFGGGYEEEDVLLPEEEEERGMFIYIAEVHNRTIGKIHLEVSDKLGAIYGFVVLPEYRRKGYGREILTKAIEKLKEYNSKEIMLQVAVKNKNALGLYISCGFQETSTMDYYKLDKK